MPKKTEQVVLSAREARQGRLGRPVLMVLLGSLVLAGIVWFGLEVWGS